MGSAHLEIGHSADIQENCFQAVKHSDMACVEQQWSLFSDYQEFHFRSRKVQIIAVPTCKRDDLLISRILASG